MLYNDNVKTITRIGGVVMLICILLAAGGGSAAAQQGSTSQYFPETGHTVSGDFWNYYRGVPEAAFLFGAPITEQFSDAVTGRVVQYFQRARFEYYPENTPGARVQLTAVGALVLLQSKLDGAVDAAPNLGCRRIGTAQYPVCYAFLEFFDKYGGETIFGQPLSPFVFYNGRIVQYFERARLEWHPENPEGQKVTLAELGRIYFDLAREDAARLQPVRAENAPADVRSLIPRAFVGKAVTRPEDSQTVFVLAQDQTLRPVAGATVILTIHWPVGGTQSVARSTNAGGIVALPLQVSGQPAGSFVVVDVEVIFLGFSTQTQTSFRVWR